MISLKNVYLNYSKKYYNLYNINLNIKQYDKIAFVGDEDSGKLELLNVISGLQKISSGEVTISGKPVKTVNFEKDCNLGMVLKKLVVFKNKTVMDNLKYVLKIRKLYNESSDDKLKDALEEYDLLRKADVKVKRLSDYEKILLQFARLSLRKVDVYLIDDLLQGLERKERKCILDIIKKISKDNKTVVLLLQDKLVAENLNYKVIEMVYGSFKGENDD